MLTGFPISTFPQLKGLLGKMKKETGEPLILFSVRCFCKNEFKGGVFWYLFPRSEGQWNMLFSAFSSKYLSF